MVVVFSDLEQVDSPQKPLRFNEGAVSQSIVNIFSTYPGQRFFNPEFGTDLDQILFELTDDITALNIESIMLAAISRWDPRVEFDSGKSNIQADPDNNRFIVNLVYKIRGLESGSFNYVGYIKK